MEDRMERWKKQAGTRRTVQGARSTPRNGNKRLENWNDGIGKMGKISYR